MYTEEKLLIITKTYPLPSSNYGEHTCVAAINERDELRRLFPIPFRLLDEDKQFARWQWINARIKKASDKRPESYRIDLDSINKLSEKSIPWPERMAILKPHIFNSFGQMEEKRKTCNQSFGIIKPNNFKLVIKAEKVKEWTKRDIENLTRAGLFDEASVRNRPLLKKLPYNFYYQYECNENGSIQEYSHMITDWEIGMLYFNCEKLYGSKWELKFREKLETEFQTKRELYLLMGTMHRFPNQWLIVGVIYPPKKAVMQELLFPPQSGY